MRLGRRGGEGLGPSCGDGTGGEEAGPVGSQGEEDFDKKTGRPQMWPLPPCTLRAPSSFSSAWTPWREGLCDIQVPETLFSPRGSRKQS